jgi:uncharacterized membrane protein SpoIIM required for sporulation
MEKMKALLGKYEMYIHLTIFVAALTLIVIGNSNPLVMALNGFVAGLSFSDFWTLLKKKYLDE